jgi:hypothetical protein
METFTSTLEPASHIDQAEGPFPPAELVAWRNLLKVLGRAGCLRGKGSERSR